MPRAMEIPVSDATAQRIAQSSSSQLATGVLQQHNVQVIFLAPDAHIPKDSRSRRAANCLRMRAFKEGQQPGLSEHDFA